MYSHEEVDLINKPDEGLQCACHADVTTRTGTEKGSEYEGYKRAVGIGSHRQARLIQMGRLINEMPAYVFDRSFIKLQGGNGTGRIPLQLLMEGYDFADDDQARRFAVRRSGQHGNRCKRAGDHALVARRSLLNHCCRRLCSAPMRKQLTADMKTWQTVKQIKTVGPGFFMRSHEKTEYAWVDAFNSSNDRDVMQIIDKQKLEVVAQ